MTRAQDLLVTFRKDFDEAVKTVEALTEEQWRMKTAEEGWPVGVVAHHLAAVAGLEQLEWVLSGHSTPFRVDINAQDAMNAQDARDFVDGTKEETLDIFRDVSSRVEKVIAALTDEQLEMRGTTAGGRPFTVEQWITITMRNHIEAHHGSILQTISETSTA